MLVSILAMTLAISSGGALTEGGTSCAVAAQIVKELRREDGAGATTFFVGPPYKSPLIHYSIKNIQEGWDGGAPRSVLVQAWRKSENINAFDCLNVRASVSATQIVDTAIPPRPDKKVISVTKPVIVGGEALVLISETMPSGSGGSYLMLMRQERGEWVSVSRRISSMY